MKRSVILFVVALAAASGARIDAHHSQAAVYAINKDAKIEGEIAQILIRSPHSFVHVNAKNEKGEMVRWALEWGGAAQLSRQGVDGAYELVVSNDQAQPVVFEGQLLFDNVRANTRLGRLYGWPLWRVTVPANGRAVLCFRGEVPEQWRSATETGTGGTCGR